MKDQTNIKLRWSTVRCWRAVLTLIMVCAIQFQIDTVSAAAVGGSDKNVTDSLQIATTLAPNISASDNAADTRELSSTGLASTEASTMELAGNYSSGNGTSKLITAKQEQMPSTCSGFEVRTLKKK